MPDVNILVYAHRRDEALHDQYSDWLAAVVDGIEPFNLSVFVAVGSVRVVTNARLYSDPSHLSTALAFVDELKANPRCRLSTRVRIIWTMPSDFVEPPAQPEELSLMHSMPRWPTPRVPHG